MDQLLEPEDLLKELAKENDLQNLMEKVHKYPYLIFTYYKKLLPIFGDEVMSICVEELRSKAERSTKSSNYRTICAQLKKLRTFAGDDVANALIDEFEEKYYRRPAFMYELSRV